MTIGACVLGVQGPELTPDEVTFFHEASPWGFVLFARNVQTPDQLRRLTDELRAAVGQDVPIFVDQEGGRVQRLRAPHWHEYPAPLDMAGAGAGAFQLRGRMLASELRAVGIDGNFAPCADIAWPHTHPFLRNRCMGTTPEQVAIHAAALAQGLLQGGVLPVVKHMPGHGRALQDSHHEIPVIAAELEELDATDFVPFKALADLPLGMTAHVRIPELGPAPATTNPDAIRMIRRNWLFRGALMSDDIGMQALQGTVRDRAEAAIAAGCDLVLHCNDTVAGMAAAAEGAGTLRGAAQDRCAAALKRRNPQPEPVDFAAMAADLAAMIQSAPPAHG